MDGGTSAAIREARKPRSDVAQTQIGGPPLPEPLDATEMKRSVLSGNGTIRRTGEPFAYSVRFLEPADIGLLLGLHREVLAAMPEPLLLYERDHSFYHQCTTNSGCVVGAFHDKAMIGYAALFTPGPEDENYGTFLGLEEADLRRVGHLAGSAVHPDYRGNRLQRLLVDVRGAYAHKAGWHHLCGEVLPSNVISIVNHLSKGYYLEGFRIDCFGLPCFILHNDMSSSPSLVPGREVVELPLKNMDGYQEMMREGRWGFEVVKPCGVYHIRFGLFE